MSLTLDERRFITYCECLLCFPVAESSKLNKRPESGVVKVVDVAYNWLVYARQIERYVQLTVGLAPAKIVSQIGDSRVANGPTIKCW